MTIKLDSNVSVLISRLVDVDDIGPENSEAPSTFNERPEVICNPCVFSGSPVPASAVSLTTLTATLLLNDCAKSMTTAR